MKLIKSSHTGKYQLARKGSSTVDNHYKNYLKLHIKNALYVPKTIVEEDELESTTDNISDTSLLQEPQVSLSLTKENTSLNNDDTYLTAVSINNENNNQQSLVLQTLVNAYLSPVTTIHEVEQLTHNSRLSFLEDSYVTLPSLSDSIHLSNDDLYLKSVSIDTTQEVSPLENIYDVPMHHEEDTYLSPITINDDNESYYPIFSPSRNNVIDNNQPIYEEVVYTEILDMPKPKPSFFQKIQSAVNYLGDHIAQASHNIAAKLNIIKSNLEPLIEEGIDKVAHFWHELNLHDNVAVHYHVANKENEESNIKFTTIKHPLVVNYFAHNDDTNNIQIIGLSTIDDCEDTYL